MPEAVILNFDSLSVPARAFSQLFAFLTPSPIGRSWCVGIRERELFAEAVKDLGGDGGATLSEADVMRAIDELAARGLATTREQSIAFSAATLDVVRTQILREQQRVWIERALRMVDHWTPENSDDPTTWRLMAELEPHLTRVLEFAEAEKIPHPTGVLMAQKLGVFLYVTGNVARAEKCMRRGLQLDEAHFGPNHPNVAVDINNLAYLLDGTGRAAETEPLKMRVVEILMQHQDAEPEKFATALTNLAGMLKGQGRIPEAERLYRQAIQVEEKNLGPAHRTLARELRNLGALLAQTNRLPEAEETVRHALAIDEKTLGGNHPSVASDLQLLASILSKQNKVEGLDRLHQRALEIDAQWFPAHGSEVLYDLLGLADVLERQGQMDRAVGTWRQVITNCEGKEPADWFPLVLSLFKVATAAAAKKDFAEAVPLYRRALSLSEEKFARNDSQTNAIRQALIDGLTAQGNFEEARTLALNEREAELRRRVEANPRAATGLNEYGLFLKNERNDFAGAERFYRQAIESAPNDATIIGNLAVLLTNVLGKHDEAEQLYGRALELAPTDGNILGNFASMVHNVRRRLDEAAQLYQLALASDPKNAAVHANYAGLLIIQDKTEEARSHLDQAWKEQSGRHDRISARVLFLQAMVETLSGQNPDECWGRLKRLFHQCMSHAPWVTDASLDLLKDRLKAEDAAFFVLIAKAIGDKSAARDLESIPHWKSLLEISLDTPWNTIAEI